MLLSKILMSCLYACSYIKYLNLFIIYILTPFYNMPGHSSDSSLESKNTLKINISTSDLSADPAELKKKLHILKKAYVKQKQEANNYKESVNGLLKQIEKNKIEIEGKRG